MKGEELTWWEIDDKVRKHHETHERIKDGVGMGVALGDFLNGCDKYDIAEMLQYLTQHEHRTIQQSAVGLFLKAIEAFGSLEESQVDGRNAIAVRKAKQIKDFMADAEITSSMPLI